MYLGFNEMILWSKHKRWFTKTSYLVLFFSNSLVQESLSQKFIGIISDSKLNFEKLLKTIC